MPRAAPFVQVARSIFAQPFDAHFGQGFDVILNQTAQLTFRDCPTMVLFETLKQKRNQHCSILGVEQPDFRSFQQSERIMVIHTPPSGVSVRVCQNSRI